LPLCVVANARVRLGATEVVAPSPVPDQPRRQRHRRRLSRLPRRHQLPQLVQALDGAYAGAAARCAAGVSGAAKSRPPSDLKFASRCVAVDNLASPAAILLLVYTSTRSRYAVFTVELLASTTASWVSAVWSQQRRRVATIRCLDIAVRWRSSYR
jgi:hypothetical protein